MAGQKPKASLSLDLDNQWSYMKTHGDAGWESFPSYLDVLIPRVLELLEQHGFKITFFVVGQDAALDKNADALAKIPQGGHEVGNHSFHHEPWLHLYSPDQIEAECSNAEAAIENATGLRPNGFRGPGFNLSLTLLETLKRRGYRYDASTFPTFLGPLARAYYFITAKLTEEERQKRSKLFGSWSEGMRPLKPYLWNLKAGPLLEVPVTTMPLTRAPFHLSYVLYLGGFSQATARLYFRSALGACRLAGVEPSVLLHPLDFLGGDDVDALRFFPAMQMKARDKIALVDAAFADLAHHYEVVSMSAHAEAITARGHLRTVEPKFPFPEVVAVAAGSA